MEGTTTPVKKKATAKKTQSRSTGGPKVPTSSGDASPRWRRVPTEMWQMFLEETLVPLLQDCFYRNRATVTNVATFHKAFVAEQEPGCNGVGLEQFRSWLKEAGIKFQTRMELTFPGSAGAYDPGPPGAMGDLDEDEIARGNWTVAAPSVPLTPLTPTPVGGERVKRRVVTPPGPGGVVETVDVEQFNEDE